MATTYNLKGTSNPSFMIGKNGVNILHGTTAPAANIGSDGDLYIRKGNIPRLYQKANLVWVQLDSTQKVVQFKSSDYQTQQPDQVVFVDSTDTPRTITLGNTSISQGKEVIIKDWKGTSYQNPITIITQGGQLIDGKTSHIINQNYESITLMCDGNDWFLI